MTASTSTTVRRAWSWRALARKGSPLLLVAAMLSFAVPAHADPTPPTFSIVDPDPQTVGSDSPSSDTFRFFMSAATTSAKVSATFDAGGSMTYTVNGSRGGTLTSGVASSAISLLPGENDVAISYTPSGGSATSYHLYLFRDLSFSTIYVQGTTDSSVVNFDTPSSITDYALTPYTLYEPYRVLLPNSVQKMRYVFGLDLAGVRGGTDCSAGQNQGWYQINWQLTSGQTCRYETNWVGIGDGWFNNNYETPNVYVNVNTTNGAVSTGYFGGRIHVVRAPLNAADGLSVSISNASPGAGTVLSADLQNAANDSNPTISYQWQAQSGSSWTTVGTSSTYTPTGSDLGKRLRVTVTADNGVSTPTTATSAETAAVQVGVPGAPTSLAATAGNAQATVSWVAPSSDGGSSIDYYKAYVTENDTLLCQSSNGSATSCSITGLTNGQEYHVTVLAHNAQGFSAAVSPSFAVTPAAPSGGSSGGSDSAPAPAPTASATPSATPTPSVTASPTPSASPSATASASATSVARPVTAGLQLIGNDPTVVVKVITVSAPLSTSPASAPVLQVAAGSAIALAVSGLPVSTAFTVSVQVPVRAKSTGVVLGKVRSDAQGRTKVPAFKATQSGTYQVRLASSSGKAFYLKVKVAGKAAAKAPGKPANKPTTLGKSTR